jgi:hypothetical protein
MSMADLEKISKDSDNASKVIGEKLGELDGIHNDIEERKKKWGEFDNMSGKKDGLINDFLGLLGSCDDEYKRFVAQLGEFSEMNSGFTVVNTEMKDHPEYELKQGLVE